MVKARGTGARRRRELKIVLDTNAIYVQSEYYLLKKEVSDLIRDSARHADLLVTWYLPDIVRHERQYQMTKQSLELLPSIQKLERILDHNLNITEDIMKRRIQEVIDRQLHELTLNILKVEPTTVDWPSIILNAAYRRPPFSTGEKEKGFRDALLVEAFMQLVSDTPKTPNTCRLVLITGDALLTEAVRSRTASASNIRTLLTIDELKVLINTIVSAVSEEFVESMKEKAKDYFFIEGDLGTLFYREKVWAKIHHEFGERLSALPAGADERERESITIGEPQFVRKDGNRIYWSNRIVERSKAYTHDTISGLPSYSGGRASGSLLVGGQRENRYTGLVIGEQPMPILLSEHQPVLRFERTDSGVKIVGDTSIRAAFSPTYTLHQTKTVYMNGETEFDVTWSVLINSRQAFSKARVESLVGEQTRWNLKERP